MAIVAGCAEPIPVYRVEVEGTANFLVVTVEDFDGGDAGSADFDVVNGNYSGVLTVVPAPGADTRPMTVIPHTPEPNFGAVGVPAVSIYTPCVVP